MMKTLLSGTAIALLLVANPAVAQTDTELEEDQVQVEAQEEPTDPAAVDDPDEDTEAAEIEDLDEPDPEAAEVEPDVDEPDVAEAPEAPTETFLSMQDEEDILASELMGASVENPEGETLGSIRDVVINDDIGVKAVVVGVGGFLGIGQKLVAINYEEIEHVRENGDVTLVFAATREQLEDAPDFQTLQDHASARADGHRRPMRRCALAAYPGHNTTTRVATP
jgi:sporulation protein YlmC with PRC-barrel domain